MARILVGGEGITFGGEFLVIDSDDSGDTSNPFARPSSGGGFGQGYRPGEWAVQCDRCGFDFYASQLRLEWTGLRVCPKCFDYKHPQMFVRGVADKIRPPWTRPEGQPVFLEPNQVSYSSGFDNGFDEGFG